MKINIKMLSLVLVATTALFSCTKYQSDLPGVGDVPDATPPEAMFTYELQTYTDSLDQVIYQVQYTDLSVSSTDYAWDLADGMTSTDKDPQATYSTFGMYDVTLTSSDKAGKSSSITSTVEIPEVIPKYEAFIFNGDFELGDTSEGKDPWRNSGLGGVLQISSDSHAGDVAAKLPSAGDRVAYQLVKVNPNTDYTITLYYDMKIETGWFKFSVLNGHVSDPADVMGATITSVDFEQDGAYKTYAEKKVSFNTGASEEIAILFQNSGMTSYFDTLSITED